MRKQLFCPPPPLSKILNAALPGFHLGGGGGGGIRPPPPCWMFAPLEILLYICIYCIVQHVALAPLWYAKTAIFPPLSKILNAALLVHPYLS